MVLRTLYHYLQSACQWKILPFWIDQFPMNSTFLNSLWTRKLFFCFLINLWFVAPDLFDSVLKKIIGLDDYTKVIVDLMDLFHFTKLIVL